MCFVRPSRLPYLGVSWGIQPDDWTTSLGAVAKGAVCAGLFVGDVADAMCDRAVDNQVFVSMCSPARDLSAGYHAVRGTASILIVC